MDDPPHVSPEATPSQCERGTESGSRDTGYTILPRDPEVVSRETAAASDAPGKASPNQTCSQRAHPPTDDDPIGAMFPGEALPGDPSRQLSLRAVFLMMTVACVALAVLVRMRPAQAAGILGAFALLGLVLLSLVHTRRFAVQFAWWLLLAGYMVASVAAILRG